MFDTSPAATIGARLAMALLRSYKRIVSPLLPPACRFEPTCSEYMHEAISVHGLAAGLWLGVKRLARCHPWNAGGSDPVPRRKVT